MDTLTFIATMTKALVWPGVLIFAAWLVRKVLPSAVSLLADRLETLKVGPVDASFRKVLDKLGAAPPSPPLTVAIKEKLAIQAHRALLQGAVGHGDQTGAEKSEEDTGTPVHHFEKYVLIEGDASPTGIVAKAWMDVGNALSALAEAYHVTVSTTPGAMMSRAFPLQNANILTAEEVNQINGLGLLRNKAVHYELPPSMDDAIRYKQVTDAIISNLMSKLPAH